MSDYMWIGGGRSHLNIGGVRVIVTDLLPIEPSFGEQIRRRVRHGLADVLAWCGEDVGPRPEDPTHAILTGGNSLLASASFVDRIRGDL